VAKNLPLAYSKQPTTYSRLITSWISSWLYRWYAGATEAMSTFVSVTCTNSTHGEPRNSMVDVYTCSVDKHRMSYAGAALQKLPSPP